MTWSTRPCASTTPARRLTDTKWLIQAKDTPAGQKMLEEMNIEYFEEANEQMYSGYADLLEGTFGYPSKMQSAAK